MTDSILMSIQDTIIQYANIISQITQAQVEIVDNNYIRIAGTGSYSDCLGEEMKISSKICEKVFSTFETQIVTSPKHDPVCTNCLNSENCIEKLIIASPIILNGEIVGVISLFAISDIERNILVEKLDLFTNFIDQISDFISIKAKESSEEQINRVYTKTLTRILDNIDQCVIVLQDDNIITSINSITKKYLNLTNDCIGEHLDLTSTGDGLHGKNEYHMKVQDKEYYIVGQYHPIYVGNQRAVKILIFSEQKQLKNSLYNLTSDNEIRTIDDIVGRSAATQKLKNSINRISKSVSTVLISGESGTGKELVAAAIWKSSTRRNEIFVPINCAAIPDTLLESELFGYVKGAFTDANPNGRIGKFELANNGVIFLDEIGDMPIYLQSKLLRVLQEQQITRIGSNNQIKIDVHVIAATNKDLPELIRQNKFREDLFYRLNVIPLKVTPLRNRPADIEDLIYFFIEKYSVKFNKYFNKIDDNALNILKSYPWPGNVRELENAVEYMINMMDDDGVFTISTLPDNIFNPPSSALPNVDINIPIRTLKHLEDMEIERALSIYGDTTKSKKIIAKKLGIAVSTLYRKLEQE